MLRRGAFAVPTPRKVTLMKQRLAQHDLIYERPAHRWEEGLPLANGRIGAMIWGGGAPLHFTLDSYSVWEQRAPWPGDDPRFTYANLRRLKEEGRVDELREVALRRRNMRYEVSGNTDPPPYPTRLSLGRLELHFAAPCRQYEARLDLHAASAAGRLQLPRGTATFRTFICSTRDVLALEVQVAGGAKLPRLALTPAAVDEFSAVHYRAWGYPEPELRREGEWHILFRRYSVNKQYSVVAREKHLARNKMRVYLTIVAGAEGEDTTRKATDVLTEAECLGAAGLRREHEAEWGRYWSRSAIALPDPLIENLYYVEMYKHHCLSRRGSLPVTLQGLWTSDGAWPPWRGSYTTDMNVQESYWPIFTANQLDSGDPLFEMYWRNLPYHRRIGEYFYGKPVPIITGEHGPGGEPFPGYVTDEHSPGAGAWIAHLFWLRWRYSMDESFLLQRAYPFMREMLQAYLAIIEKRADGKYHIPFTDSPEYYGGDPTTMGDDTTYDVMLLRFLLTALLSVQDRLPRRDSDEAHWGEILEHLVEPATTRSIHTPRPNLGLRPGEPLARSHRHHSHLIGIYPLGLLDPARGVAEKQLIDASLCHLAGQGTGEWTGWSYPWASMIAGRSGYPWQALAHLKTYVDAFVTCNSFHVNGDFKHKGESATDMVAMTLEAGFAAAAAILEMLLQSNGGLLRVFPTCPPAWADVRFRDLRAEGAFAVSAIKSAGAVRHVAIVSEVGGMCRIRNPFDGNAVLVDEGGRRRVLRGDILSFRTRRGGRYDLTAAAAPLKAKDRAWRLPHRPAAQRNWFGAKKIERF